MKQKFENTGPPAVSVRPTLAEELERSPNFQVQAYTLEVLLELVSPGAIRDPSDRAIVAPARHLRCPLITADGIIQDGDWVDTVRLL
jgi:PIN domain nuclease of toxin-antitoxin system